jgi:peptidoglycan/LPS O-acetylase OafA/YrhL
MCFSTYWINILWFLIIITGRPSSFSFVRSMPLFAAVIWLGAMESDCLLRHWLSLKPFLLLGQVSFTVYILQGCAYTYTIYWITPWMNRQFGLNLNPLWVFVVVVNVFGFLVHFIFEQPAYNALLFLDSRGDNKPPSLSEKAHPSGAKTVSGLRGCLNTFISYEWVRILGYYLLMVVSVGGYGESSPSISFLRLILFHSR